MIDDEDYWLFEAKDIDSIFDLVSNLKGEFVCFGEEIKDKIELELVEGVINFRINRGFLGGKFQNSQALYINIEGYKCQVTDLDVSFRSFNCIEGKIRELESENFNECEYDHLVYGIGCLKKPDLLRVIDVGIYQTPMYCIKGHIELFLNDNILNVIEYKTVDGASFIVFDLKDESIEVQDFEEMSYLSSIGIGYILGHFYNNYAITVKYKEGEIVGWKYNKTRGSIKSYYKPLNSDYESYLALSKEEKNEIKQLGMSRVSQSSINILCSRIAKSSRFQVLLLLLIESVNGSLISAPSLLSVALEELSSICLDREKKAPQPIKEKKKFREIRKKMLDVINEYDDECFSQDGKKILEKKIDNINSPPNSNKLLSPFIIYNIQLTDLEKDALQQRNKFLHGETYHRVNKNGGRQEIENVELFKTMLRLYHLTSILTLKLIGYEGVILNHVKTHINPDLTREEFLYREI